ncbi:YeeE/YedE family protein [Myxococcota bacterium]|nr:YeeE/YedE family protein [Myxococcota bacterium]
MLLFSGRVAGISGIFGGLLTPKAGDIGWRAAFVAGLLVGGLLLALVAPQVIAPTALRSTPATVLAGLLVGFGVRMGNGCTSGHGVCGLSRFSRRSLVATLSFMATGFLTASLVQLAAEGRL